MRRKVGGETSNGRVPAQPVGRATAGMVAKGGQGSSLSIVGSSRAFSLPWLCPQSELVFGPAKAVSTAVFEIRLGAYCP